MIPRNEPSSNAPYPWRFFAALCFQVEWHKQKSWQIPKRVFREFVLRGFFWGGWSLTEGLKNFAGGIRSRFFGENFRRGWSFGASLESDGCENSRVANSDHPWMQWQEVNGTGVNSTEILMQIRSCIIFFFKSTHPKKRWWSQQVRLRCRNSWKKMFPSFTWFLFLAWSSLLRGIESSTIWFFLRSTSWRFEKFWWCHLSNRCSREDDKAALSLVPKMCVFSLHRQFFSKVVALKSLSPQNAEPSTFPGQPLWEIPPILGLPLGFHPQWAMKKIEHC